VGVRVASSAPLRQAVRARTRARSQHPEATPGTGEQALVDDRGDPVEGLRPAYRLGGLDREAAREERELGEQLLVGRVGRS
jgi:hypothetical protein